MKPIEFWRDETRKHVHPKLYSDQAEQLAKTFKADMDRQRTANKPTQVRKFYDEVVRLNIELKQKKSGWEDIEPMLNMLVAKAAYAKGRKLVSDNFLKFIQTSVQKTGEKELPVFANFFEAFMGFYKYYSELPPERGRRR